ncbi:hypothetical protein ZOSMA_10061G00010 [Zostera marina]|uniref:Uncharacterized protein n=1 Tax=Zostera marina TaxID=29655 RepID=A0A0K9Q5K3_ZOSMR|nr:hypothetical protein ZOSMA_10061G00010 [Zostera marina]
MKGWSGFFSFLLGYSAATTCYNVVLFFSATAWFFFSSATAWFFSPIDCNLRLQLWFEVYHIYNCYLQFYLLNLFDFVDLSVLFCFSPFSVIGYLCKFVLLNLFDFSANLSVISLVLNLLALHEKAGVTDLNILSRIQKFPFIC